LIVQALLSPAQGSGRGSRLFLRRNLLQHAPLRLVGGKIDDEAWTSPPPSGAPQTPRSRWSHHPISFRSA